MSEGERITREEAIANLDLISVAFEEEPFTKEQREFIDKILDIAFKTLEQTPKMGRWLHRNDDHFDWCECPFCGYGSDGEVELGNETPFCPMCGAKLEG